MTEQQKLALYKYNDPNYTCGDCGKPILEQTCPCGTFPFEEPESPEVRLTTRNVYYANGKLHLSNQLFINPELLMSKFDIFDQLFELFGIKEGDEFSIKLERTGNRPYGDKRLICSIEGFKEETEQEYQDRVASTIDQETK